MEHRMVNDAGQVEFLCSHGTSRASCLGGFILTVLLSGCETIPQQFDSARYTAQLSGATHCYLKDAVIAWSDYGTIRKFCGENAIGCEVNRLVLARKPEGWNDWATLRTLGHEVLHLCGERHEVVR